MSKPEKNLSPLNDPEYDEHHNRYDSSPSGYWEWAARRFGTEQVGWKAVLHCGSSVQYNRYIDFVHRRALQSFISKSRGQRVLDLGCGVGRLTTRFAKRGTHVIGVDRSQSMLSLAQQAVRVQRLKATFAQMDLVQLGLRDNSFDLVACVVVLLHLKQDTDFQTAVREMLRVTRPNGYVLILDEIPKERSLGQVTRKRVLDDYREAVEAAGGEIEQVRFVAVSPYKLVLSHIQNSSQPDYIKSLATWLSYVILGAMDLTLTRSSRIPLRFWMEDRLVIIRKPSPQSS